MLKSFYHLPIRYPVPVLVFVAIVTALALSAMGGLRWETDARVYFPKDHPAIAYDAKVEDVFGGRDAIIVAIVNDEGIFNPETLARVARITDKVAKLPGVLAQRRLDVESLATASIFRGTDEAIFNEPLMETPPTTPEEVERVRRRVYEHPDLFVGNLVSPDGTATMIRVKIKEGIENRYQSYFQIKGILAGELSSGDGGGGWPKGGWSSEGGDGQWSGNQWSQGGGDSGGKTGDEADGDTDTGGDDADGWSSDGQSWGNFTISDRAAENGDRFYLAGRPVIEVTSGQYALDDLRVMIPLLAVTIVAVLLILFRNLRGILLPLAVVTVSIVWTMGAMAALDVPLYTISTMLPVILVAVGIGDALHMMTHYEDLVVESGMQDTRGVMVRVVDKLGVPLLVTTLTTAAGFLSLWWAEMPPFKVFGVFTALGIVFCWLASITIVPAFLSVLQPKVSGYLQRRRSLRVHAENGALTRGLTSLARWLMARRVAVSVVLVLVIGLVGLGAGRLVVDSSWISDFKEGSEVELSNRVLNEKFDGTVFLNVILDSGQDGGLRSPLLLEKIERMQAFVEGLDGVGGSLSVVDYLKSTNKTFHAEDPAYDRLPATAEEIGSYFYLLSLSGRPELLNSVIDYNDRQANVTIAIRTDHTQRLKAIIDAVRAWSKREFAGTGVTVHFAGSANNAYIWADLLIKSQFMAILLSKIGIFLMAMLLFRSPTAAFFTVVPVVVTTLVVAGATGWLRIPLDVSTVLAAGVAIGVGVDYAVHFVYRYAIDRERHADAEEAILESVRAVGKPVVFNAAVVTAGFFVLSLSQFPPHIKLGYFVAAYMVVACLAALLILPVLLAFFRPRLRSTARLQMAAEGTD